jgi:hypothetical protein
MQAIEFTRRLAAQNRKNRPEFSKFPVIFPVISEF